MRNSTLQFKRRFWKKKMEEDQNLFQDNNASQKTKQKQNKEQNQKTNKKKITSLKPYNAISIKTRNFLTNISYDRITEEDFFNQSFVFDIYIQLTKNLNPFSVEHNMQNKKAKKWSICSGSNTVLLNSTRISAKKKIFYPFKCYLS